MKTNENELKNEEVTADSATQTDQTTPDPYAGLTEKQIKKLKKKEARAKKKSPWSVKNFFSDFAKFISKGNIIDLAVAMIIGAAFTAIVNSLVNDLVMPLLGSLLSPEALDSLTWQLSETVSVNWGKFIMAVVNFLVIAFAIFVVLRILLNTQKGLDKIKKQQLKAMKKKLKKGEVVTPEEVAAAVAPAAPLESELDILKDIRTLLLANAGLTKVPTEEVKEDAEPETKQVTAE